MSKKKPDQVADNIYGDPELDWVVLTSANIINVRDEWPLDSREMYEFASNKYGNDLNQIRHYETKEVKDSSGRLILPKGKVVDSGFTIPDPSSPTATLNPVGGVTNYEYESKLNDAKRSIYIISPDYLQVFLNEDCKDAINFDEFINTLQLDISDLDITRQYGYINGMSNIFIKGLREFQMGYAASMSFTYLIIMIISLTIIAKVLTKLLLKE